jgi:hypothetical protein
MKKAAFGVVVANALLVFVSLSVVGAKAAPVDPLAELISHYRTWKRVNDEPIHMQPIIAASCVGPTAWQKSNPHDRKYFTVFVNKIGAEAMMKEGTTHFPEGSIIVKEKMPALAAQPELLTVMVKRPAGYDSAHGDWQYFIADGVAQKTSTDNAPRCQSCHDMDKENDYVFRSYVPKADQPNWRKG